MKYLFISSLLICLLSGCKLSLVNPNTKTAVTHQEIKNPYFSNPEFDYVYKTNIDLYTHSFSGILIVKKIGKTTHRLLFTSQFGNTLFDIEFYSNGYKVNSIIKELNRKIILNTLISDFSVLLRERFTNYESYSTNTSKVLKTEEDKRINYYFYNPSDSKLLKIKNTTLYKEKFEILFDKTKEDFAEEIAINHFTIKLKIKLNLLKK